MSTLTADNLSHSYDGQSLALHPLTTQWSNGTTYALLGPSGCGKTTLLSLLSGLLQASAGRILCDERDVTRLGPVERDIAQVFQFPVIYDTMSVSENLMFPLKKHRCSAAERRSRVNEVAEILGLQELLKAPARQLPMHLKQLVSLGRALVRKEVAAILLDEPLTVVDPSRKASIRRQLKKVQQVNPTTMIYVTHDQHEALTFAEQIMVMKDGALLQTGSAQELFESPLHPFVGKFIGSPGINLLTTGCLAHVKAPPGKTVAGIRAGHLKLHSQESRLEAHRGPILRGQVTQVQAGGWRQTCWVNVGRGQVVVQDHQGAVWQPGQQVQVSVDADRCCFFDDGGESMWKPYNNRAWWLVVPVFGMVAFTVIVPLMTVVNYSVQDILGPGQEVFVGWDWYREVLANEDFRAAFWRQLGFSAAVLAIEIPLGIMIARWLPSKGFGVGVSLMILALPLMIPFNVVGTIWQIMARGDIGLMGWGLRNLGMDYNYAEHPLDAWLTLLLVDIWHWLPLVVLLVYSGLRAIPPAYYQAAAIDGASRWDVFWLIQLPKLKQVLVIALLLRFMDSFIIYTEPFVITGGGPGDATTFLSQYLTRLAVGQFDLGTASAFSIVYFLIILTVCFTFYSVIVGGDDTEQPLTHQSI